MEMFRRYPIGGLAMAKARRHGLHEAMTALETAVAGPSSWDGWLARVRFCLTEARQAVDDHIEAAEGPHGLFAEIMESTPRLGSEVEILRQEHRQLVNAVTRAQELSREVEVGTGPNPLRLRRAVTGLLGRLTLHRQHGSDLVFEAYNVDIGSAD
ncbi:MAG: hypothetical protein WEE53_04400 [Acidimicrobiia bacterium]